MKEIHVEVLDNISIRTFYNLFMTLIG